MTFGDYNDIFSTEDNGKIIKPQESTKFHIMLHSKSSWPPGIRTIKSNEASVVGEVQNIIPPKEIVSLIESQVSIGLPIIINVGRSGYQLGTLSGDISFQYLETVNIFYGEITEIYAYLSGNGSVNIDITTENLDIVEITSGNVKVEPPFTVSSTNRYEHLIIVRVKGVMPNSTAYLHYQIMAGGEIQEYITQVNVGLFRVNEGLSYTTTILIGILLIGVILGVLIYVIHSHLKYSKK